MATSVYKSHTHGPIPLSEKGKRLMHTLRIAIQEAIQKGDYNQMNAVAHARGELAKYMSELEANQQIGGWNLSGYRKLMDDMAKDAMIYGKGVTKTWRGPGINVQNLPRGLTGNRAELIMIDDPQQELDMSKKAVATRAKTAAQFMPVGIRFIHGHNLAKTYTYKAKRAAKLHLGQEVVVRNHSEGTNVAVVVELDGPIPNGWTLDSLVELFHKVAPL